MSANVNILSPEEEQQVVAALKLVVKKVAYSAGMFESKEHMMSRAAAIIGVCMSKAAAEAKSGKL